MLGLYRLGITIASLLRQFEALKRKDARVIAAVILKPVADEIIRKLLSPQERVKLSAAAPQPLPLESRPPLRLSVP